MNVFRTEVQLQKSLCRKSADVLCSDLRDLHVGFQCSANHFHHLDHADGGQVILEKVGRAHVQDVQFFEGVQFVLGQVQTENGSSLRRCLCTNATQVNGILQARLFHCRGECLTLA